MKITFITGDKHALQTKKAKAWYEKKNYVISDNLWQESGTALKDTEIKIYNYLGDLDFLEVEKILQIIDMNEKYHLIFTCKSLTKSLVSRLMERKLNFSIVPCKTFNEINN